MLPRDPNCWTFGYSRAWWLGHLNPPVEEKLQPSPVCFNLPSLNWKPFGQEKESKLHCVQFHTKKQNLKITLIFSKTDYFSGNKKCFSASLLFSSIELEKFFPWQYDAKFRIYLKLKLSFILKQHARISNQTNINHINTTKLKLKTRYLFYLVGVRTTYIRLIKNSLGGYFET